MEFGRENNCSGGGVVEDDPPNKFAIPEMRPPNPPNPPRPPPNALDTPPETAFDKRLPQTDPEGEVEVTLLLGFPNWML
jgi:hypothetical protein